MDITMVAIVPTQKRNLDPKKRNKDIKPHHHHHQMSAKHFEETILSQLHYFSQINEQ